MTMTGYFNKARVETFSDGIFAIIVTLLVLELKVPEIHDHGSAEELAYALKGVLPKLLCWIISFGIVCVIWVNHHRIFERMRAMTHGIFWLNANLLLWCSLIPFPTALIGDYPGNPLALVVFGLALACMPLSFYLLRLGMLASPEVLNEDTDIGEFRKETGRSLVFGPILYLAGTLCGLLRPWLAFAVYGFIPLYFIFRGSNRKDRG
jgi:uncharacterized membrane protein